jgi:hypothetical protein
LRRRCRKRDQRTLPVFISSPSDVGLERDLCSRVIERLQGEVGERFNIEEIRWEKRPARATDDFQSQIVPPSETDIVVGILWSRLGSPLPAKFRKPDGSRYVGGTEWEFEDARRGFELCGFPDLLVYRRTEKPKAELGNKEEVLRRQAQFEALETFIDRWFVNDDGSFKRAFKTYEKPATFEQLLETDLRSLLNDRLPPEHLRMTTQVFAGGVNAARW